MELDTNEYPDPTENSATIELRFGTIKVTTWEQNGSIAGQISSNLHDDGAGADPDELVDVENFNHAINGLESFVLAYACEAGVDACTEKNFVDALNNAIEQIGNQYA